VCLLSFEFLAVFFFIVRMEISLFLWKIFPLNSSSLCFSQF
jgi:hypothetical protein